MVGLAAVDEHSGQARVRACELPGVAPEQCGWVDAALSDGGDWHQLPQQRTLVPTEYRDHLGVGGRLWKLPAQRARLSRPAALRLSSFAYLDGAIDDIRAGHPPCESGVKVVCVSMCEYV